MGVVLIVPTGELEGRQDVWLSASVSILIVPTGELEGRQDPPYSVPGTKTIVPTGELEGRQDLCLICAARIQNCTNWGIGRPARQ